MKVVVPDASVILKWVLPDPSGEEGLDAALRLRDAVISEKVYVKVPSLWLYEVGNTLTRRFPRQAADALQLLIAFGLEESVPDDRWLSRAVGLTHDHGVTFYDAAYHALALVEKGIFVTADQKYIRKAGKAGRVISLADWGASQ
ncbi:MAG TPA: type II toxin-antitoxin system VapC family toxin [Acidiferrobacterales bacterium]|nr:type II toxin-antitoxin system VapC family toxin [Acidiferrobacterales bacterium]